MCAQNFLTDRGMQSKKFGDHWSVLPQHASPSRMVCLEGLSSTFAVQGPKRTSHCKCSLNLAMNHDTVSWQSQRLSKTRSGILESEHSLLQRRMHGGYCLLVCIPQIEADIPLFNFLSISFSPMGQCYAAEWLHRLHNTWSAFSHCPCSVRKALRVFPQGVWLVCYNVLYWRIGYFQTLLFGQNRPKLAKR